MASEARWCKSSGRSSSSSSSVCPMEGSSCRGRSAARTCGPSRLTSRSSTANSRVRDPREVCFKMAREPGGELTGQSLDGQPQQLQADIDSLSFDANHPGIRSVDRNSTAKYAARGNPNALACRTSGAIRSAIRERRFVRENDEQGKAGAQHDAARPFPAHFRRPIHSTTPPIGFRHRFLPSYASERELTMTDGADFITTLTAAVS